MSSDESKDEGKEVSVDQNLSDALKDFLSQCEKDFSNRYGEEDEEFSHYLRQKSPTPPIVHPWSRSQHGFRHSGGNYSRNYDRRDRYDDRSHHDSRSYHSNRDRYDQRGRWDSWNRGGWKRSHDGEHRHTR